MAYVSILAPENYCFCVKNSVFYLFTARKKVALCTFNGDVHVSVLWCRFPQSPRSHEASPALRGGPYGLAVYQRGVRDLALQHVLYPQTGSASALQ